jgi:hypothetical protein
MDDSEETHVKTHALRAELIRYMQHGKRIK